MTNNKSAVIRALKEERRDLTERLRAVNLALEAFGITPGSRGPDLQPRRSRGNRVEVERALRDTIAGLDRRGQPWTRQQIITLADIPKDGGTISRSLRAVLDDGLLVQRGRLYYLPADDKNGQPADPPAASSEELRIRAGEGVIAQK